ncbi:bis(5'-nucleosyl)-tetraphosphatase [asymmetrical] [Condylostylus longicornis]|uniref:bis(5'-nucleosyl)-tetraphosphatase [asymmetrical] n=1 Tax=Condylostylus longicornis TaxID=2530218 RepID=UPI00244DCB20|nr:bis(5'-nucleosyl)-tetraphosphatase [asymmetrical] [Condylostylus longicornis]
MVKRAAGFLVFRILNNQIEYLLLRASYGIRHWSPPKGHVDPGEDDFTTALRETKEEAGYSDLDLKIYTNETMTLKYDVDGVPKSVIYWLAELVNPCKNPVLSDEHTEYKWLPKNEAKELAKFKDFQDLIDFFHDKINK